MIVTDPCPTCRGQGRLRQTREHTIQVPGGVDTGLRLVDQGQGDAGLRGGPRGDLYVVIYVQPHPHFTRRGNDVVHEAPVTFAQAALGDTFDVPVLGGVERLTVPEGTQPGETFRLRGRGFPDVNSRTAQRGDQIVVIKLQVPTRLTDDQRRLLKEYAAASGEKLSSDERGLFEKMKEAIATQVGGEQVLMRWAEITIEAGDRTRRTRSSRPCGAAGCDGVLVRDTGNAAAGRRLPAGGRPAGRPD